MKIIGTTVVCAASVLVASVLASAAPAGANAATCTPGVKTIAGASARTFCGPAKATVTLNGKTVSYKGGICSTSIGLFSINVGTVVVGTTMPNAPEYFGVAAKAKPGKQARQTISVVHAGATRGIIGTVTLTAGLNGGTFAGKVFGSSAGISGSFTC
jgi:hypothetical protein